MVRLLGCGAAHNRYPLVERNVILNKWARPALLFPPLLWCGLPPHCSREVAPPMWNCFVGKTSAPRPEEKRFAAYMDGLAEAAAHADRAIPLKNYCTRRTPAVKQREREFLDNRLSR
jgi:hypothetical protein